MSEKYNFELDPTETVSENLDSKKEKEGIVENFPIPNFLYERDGKLWMGFPEDGDITNMYNDFLKSVNRRAPVLPKMFYERDGALYQGTWADSDVTDIWNEWLNTLEPDEESLE